MQKDLIVLFKCFHENEVKYLVIGGLAAMAYGVNRTTLDLDIIIEPTLQNADNLLKAMLEAGFGTADLATPELILQQEISIFNDRCRVDVQTRSKALNFEEAWARKLFVDFAGMQFFVVAKEDLLAMKRAYKRDIDLYDVDHLAD